MPKAAVVIPARLKSTRLPDKMLLSETGYPLVVHTAARAQEAAGRTGRYQALRSAQGTDSPKEHGGEDHPVRVAGGEITSVVVATDSPKIAAAVEENGFRAVMTSPDHPTGSDRLAEAAAGIEEDIIINLQGDEPETAPSVLLSALSSLLESPDASVATCAFPIDEKQMQQPTLVKVVTDREGWALYFSRAAIPFRRDDMPSMSPRALGHVGIYVYRKEVLAAFPQLPRGDLEQMEALEQLRFLESGYRIKVSVVDSAPKGVDSEQDYTEFVARYRASGRKGP